MANRQQESPQMHVRAQFDRQVAHYLYGSAMADQELLERIVRLARPAPGMRVLDVACGAGFLA
jgi:cyclopropane fatty-acyl-phospholipid synthase-like methyltransferase